MIIYNVVHIEDKGLYRNVNLKLIGYFSTIEKALCSIETVKNLQGFKDSPNGFIIKEMVVEYSRRSPYVYELNQCLYDADYTYTYEYSKTISLYPTYQKAIVAKKRFKELNSNSFMKCKLKKDIGIDRILIDEVLWTEGFETYVCKPSCRKE